MPPSAAPYRLAHGSPLSDAQAAQLITRTAQGEALNFAPVKRGPLWVLAHLATLSTAERLDLARRVRLAAQLLDLGTVPALPDLDGYPRCPDCAQSERFTSAAFEHLGQLLAPHLGAWAHHYAAQGMTPGALFSALESWAGGDLNEHAQREHLGRLLSNAETVYRPPAFTPAPPDRVQLDARTVPQLLDVLTDPTQTQAEGAGRIDRRRSFVIQDSDGRQTQQHPAPGLDVVLITNTTPEGDALLIYTGIDGQTNYTGAQPLRVPAAFLPQVRAALGYTFTAGGVQ